MKTSKLGVIFKLGIFSLCVGLIAWGFGIVYNGYKYVDTDYCGSYFLSWRTKLVDSILTSQTYSKLNLNHYPVNEELENYINIVGGKDTGRKFKRYGYGIFDSFVLGPSLSWTVFTAQKDVEKNLKDKSDATKRMEAEKNFLDMRSAYIENLFIKPEYNIDYSKKRNKDWKTADFHPVDLSGAKIVSNYFIPATHNDIKNFFGQEPYKATYDAFNTIVKKIIKNESDYGVIFDKKAQTAQMTDKFLKDVRVFVDSVFSKQNSEGISDKVINDFFFAIGTVKVDQYQSHALNRLALYFLYTHNYVTDEQARQQSIKLQSLNRDLEELMKLPPTTEDKEIRRRASKQQSLIKKMGITRNEMILAKFDMLLAKVLGKKIVLGKGDDNRSIFRKIGSPDVATLKSYDEEEEFKFNNKLFEKEIDNVYIAEHAQ